eukprot:4482036-Amphidinium_carterae.1
MTRDIQAQQEVTLGQIRAEFEKAQREIDDLRSQLDSTERQRDTSMQQCTRTPGRGGDGGDDDDDDDG